MTNFDDLKAAAAQTAAVADTNERLPRLGWRNGAKQAKTPGFFYISADDLGPDVPSNDWQEVNIYGEEIGYTATSLRLASIGHRMQAFLTEDTGAKYPTTTWLPRWEPGAKLFTEALVLVEGLPGIWSWNIKGMTGKAVTGKGGIFDQHKRFVKTASAAISATFSPWAFWVTIGGKTDHKGGPLYEDTGFKSFVTPPALLGHDDGDVLAQANRLFVGKDQYAELTRQYHMFKGAGWFEQQRGNVSAPVAVDDAMSRGEARGAAYEAGQTDWSSDSPNELPPF